MNTIEMTECRIARQVDEMFGPAPHGAYCENPVTLASYIHGADPIEPQKEAARRALRAREWFAIHGPADAQQLSLNHISLSADYWQSRGLFGYMVHLYGRSLEGEFDVKRHPLFADYVSGVLWEAACVDNGIGTLPENPAEIAALERRFPPKKLARIGPSFCWEPPPELYAEFMLTPRQRGIACASS